MPTNPTREPHGRFTKAYRSVGVRASSSPEQTTHQRPRAPGCANSLFVGQHQNISRDAAGPAWSICTPLAALKTWFSPVPVNNPCRSHTHRATPRVVRQPSETVLYREFPSDPASRRGRLVYRRPVLPVAAAGPESPQNPGGLAIRALCPPRSRFETDSEPTGQDTGCLVMGASKSSQTLGVSG